MSVCPFAAPAPLRFEPFCQKCGGEYDQHGADDQQKKAEGDIAKKPFHNPPHVAVSLATPPPPSSTESDGENQMG